jgi:ATP-binding cassette, subfamily B, bacterial PglK
MLLSSIAEILSIGSVFPFLAVLTAPERIESFPLFKHFIPQSIFLTPSRRLVFFTLFFGLASLIAGAMRLALLWLNIRISFAAGADLSMDIYRRTLYQPYEVHCSRNTSHLIAAILEKSNIVIYNVIVPILTIISSVFMVIAILAALIAISSFYSLFVLVLFGIIYGLIILVTQNRLRVNSLIHARESTRVIKSLQEGLGGIRDILIDGSQEVYCAIYKSADRSLRLAQGNNLFISSSPRFAMESLGMMLIAILAFYLYGDGEEIQNSLPMLGAIALGAQRLLPVLQQIYSSWASIQGSEAALREEVSLLAQPLGLYYDDSGFKSFLFKDCIELTSVSFTYGNEETEVINNVTLTLTKGSRTGLIGKTGCGKSTLIDIIMGLLKPTSGTLKVDGKLVSNENIKGWQSHIAHVPQVIFLADTSIEENIAFGIPLENIDINRVKEAAKRAHINESIEKLPNGYLTLVGERGVRLSGGQRQRIGIARALYKQADVIVLDEATSALDNETEESVMEMIESLSLDLTVIIVAHRITTLKKCDQIIELDQGKIKKICTYDELF